MVLGDRMDLRGSIPLYTRMGREIPNAQYPDLAPAIAERLQNELRRRYLTASERRPPTGQYNCHGLAFANRRTGIYEVTALEGILEDDGFRPIRLSQVQPGDLAVYFDGGEITHTGVVLQVVEGYPEGSGLRAARVVSKWGQAGEYVHLANEGPYSEHEIVYRTDRP